MAPSVTPGPQTQPIIETQYRLHPADLDGKPSKAQIANVTFQGIEAMQPVLHFTGHAKRLTLTPAQSRQMVTITGTTIVTQWIGASKCVPVCSPQEMLFQYQPGPRSS
jgi:hypothetical protein